MPKVPPLFVASIIALVTSSFGLIVRAFLSRIGALMPRSSITATATGP